MGIAWIVAGITLLIVVLFLVDSVKDEEQQKKTQAWQEKGKRGEIQVYKILEQVKGRKEILTNCYIPKENGETTEIDLILLHESGIYVIESKNYSGEILGDEKQKYWIQRLNDTSETRTFYNPLWQNRMHIRCLRQLLNDKGIPCYSYIVFGNNCNLKNIQLASKHHHVTCYQNLLEDVIKTAQNTKRRLSEEKIAEIYAVLVKFANATEEQKLKHIERLREKGYSDVRPSVCPRCGGLLVPRVAKSGKNVGKMFWGCSNYPKCHFIYNE